MLYGDKMTFNYKLDGENYAVCVVKKNNKSLKVKKRVQVKTYKTNSLF